MVQSISSLRPTSSLSSVENNQSLRSALPSNETFADHLKSAIQQIDNHQKLADEQTKQLVNGESDDLHHVMITAQKASIALETSVQIQRKVIDAYNEIMRMQI